ncbi:Transposase and inactivated derivatives, TnpA family [Burkholderia stabilis]|uniref:Transposase and inactivated derivatives, TnpA family n=1 Tax=Burkholderia stabilis TaxID=95485 RepID=A0AAJ5NE61_9BURK|nr:Transposase and inactivated derivatives, TnpA family [Burkholderia stabilis]
MSDGVWGRWDTARDSCPRRQLRAGAEITLDQWEAYGQRDQTHREHVIELQSGLQARPLAVANYRSAVRSLVDLAMQTDKGIVLAHTLIEHLRRQAILLPGADVIERICAEAITRAARRIYNVLMDPLSDEQRLGQGHRRHLVHDLTLLQ